MRNFKPVAITLVMALTLIATTASTIAADRVVPQIPDTHAGRMFSEWLAMFDSGDPARAEAFERDHGGEPTEETLGYRDYSGGVELLRIEHSESLRLRARLRERDAGMADIRLELALDPANPQRIARLTVEPQTIERLPIEAALDALNARVDALAAEDRFSGAFLVARGDRILLRRSVGLADRERGLKLRPETRLRYASVGKMFTAVATLQLIEQGKLGLDDTVGKYLPDYPNRDVATKVRIRHLLSHSAGVGDVGFWDSAEFASAREFLAYRSRMRTHADYVARYADNPLAFEPGAEMAYSNYGYILLGRIIETIAGTSLDEHLRLRIFAPAGMRATGSAPETTKVRGRAIGYTLENGRWIDARERLPWSGTAAGGGYTTIDDLLKFARALQDGRLLSATSLAEATRAQAPSSWYGYGFIAVGQGPLRRYGHSGDFPGMNADFRVFPESGYVLIAMSNIDSPAAYRLFRFFEPRMPLD